MDLSLILGGFLGLCLVLFGILFNGDTGSFVFGNLFYFVDWPSIAITCGGTMAVLVMSFPIKMLIKIPKHIKIILFPSKYDPVQYIDQIVEFAREARMKGLLSLEDKLNGINDDFLRNSLMLVVDSVEPEKVKQLLESEIDYLDDRHAQDRDFYDKGAAFAPAFGMIGTLIGLINMLQALDDPDAIGPAMSVALVTTFYGSVLANMVFLPVSYKLKNRHEQEILCKMLISEGVQAIQAGENPKFIEEKLNQFLPSYLSKRSEEMTNKND